MGLRRSHELIVGNTIKMYYLGSCNVLFEKCIESAYNAGDPGSIPGSGRPPGEGNDN